MPAVTNRTMDHWDEIRMFLAVAEGGSVRAAADALGVNHATVIRGVARLENRLGTKLFEKVSSGYRLTEAGTEILNQAKLMATASSRIEAKAFGLDQQISGPLRLTLPVSFATDLLMPSLTAFRDAYPDIALEIIGSTSLANLGNREADVALRVVVSGGSLPDALFGTKLCNFYTAFYCHHDVFKKIGSSPAWLLGIEEAVPADWYPTGGFDVASIPIRFAEMRSQFEAARAGMGMMLAPCFLGDADPLLVRVPGGPVAHTGDVWLLTHDDTRRTKRVRLLCDHLRSAIRSFASCLEGNVVQYSSTLAAQ